MKQMAETLGIAEAKANLTAVVRQVEKRRRPVHLTRNGQVVASIVPQDTEDPLARYKFGGGRIVGDIDSPVNDPEDWEYD